MDTYRASKVSAAAQSQYRDYLGTGFEVWAAQQSWFWFVDKPHSNSAAIGAAASEAEAVRAACSAIEASMPRLQLSHPITLATWECSLAKLERYLIGAREAAA
jgi:hypothetical protein